MIVKFGCLVNLVAFIVGCLVGSVLKVDLAGKVNKKKGDFRFWIVSDAWRVSLCFSSLYISDIL